MPSLPRDNSHAWPEMGAADAVLPDVGFLTGPTAVRQQNEFRSAIGGSFRKNRAWFAAAAVCLALVVGIGIAVHLRARKTHQARPEPATSQTINRQPTPHTENSAVPGNALEETQETAKQEIGSKPSHSRALPPGRNATREAAPPFWIIKGSPINRFPSGSTGRRRTQGPATTTLRKGNMGSFSSSNREIPRHKKACENLR